MWKYVNQIRGQKADKNNTNLTSIDLLGIRKFHDSDKSLPMNFSYKSNRRYTHTYTNTQSINRHFSRRALIQPFLLLFSSSFALRLLDMFAKLRMGCILLISHMWIIHSKRSWRKVNTHTLRWWWQNGTRTHIHYIVCRSKIPKAKVRTLTNGTSLMVMIYGWID